MHNDKLVITYSTKGNQISEIEDSACDFKLHVELDPSDMSTHQLMNVFAKVLSAIGYSEFSIMKAACALTFNEWRDTEMMNKLVEEYELDKVSEEFRAEQERKKIYESVNCSSMDNDSHEPA